MFTKKQKFKKNSYSFKGWKNDEQRKRFHGSVDFWGEEVLAKRTLPEAPQGVVVIRTKENEIDGIGTPLGAHIEVQYYDVEMKDVNEIEKFFSDSGILVEPIE